MTSVYEWKVVVGSQPVSGSSAYQCQIPKAPNTADSLSERLAETLKLSSYFMMSMSVLWDSFVYT